MIVATQIISKIILSHDLSIYTDNNLTPEYFAGYEDEINFILEHYEKYGNVPDRQTYVDHFTDSDGNCSVEIVEVNETDRYLIDTIREEHLYTKSAEVINKYVQLVKTDSNAANEYLASMSDVLQPNYSIGGIDIVNNAESRLQAYRERKANPTQFYLESGFKELDELTNGFKRGEELVVVVARSGIGKSWVIEKMCTHVWQTGHNVGFISPEMGAESVGYRFDTLYRNFSNKDLMRGRQDVDEEEYEKYVEDLKSNNHKFIVATPLDFNKELTITKIKNFIKQNKLELLAIDGISYIRDERSKRSDNKTITLTNISEDLMSLSVEVGIPIVVAAQSNRSGVKEDGGSPELDNIRDSDGIAFNASLVIGLGVKKDSNILELRVVKQRNGRVGDKLHYQWDANVGTFQYIDEHNMTQSVARTRVVAQAKDVF